MTYDIPLSALPPRPLGELAHAVRSRVMTTRDLREHGVSAVAANECCRPGGPWQLLLPGVYVLHPGPLTGDERLYGALLYAGGGHPETATSADAYRGAHANPAANAAPSPAPVRPFPVPPVPARPASGGREAVPEAGPAMITGLAALALHGFAAAPAPCDLDRLDVLVPRAGWRSSTGCVRLVPGGPSLPLPTWIAELPVAPVPRALADAVGRLADAAWVRRLLVESVRAGHCEPAAVVRELRVARLLGRPHVADAVEALLAEGRALAEGLLHDMVFRFWLPDPFWNVSLRLPGGPRLGGVDAYWPEQAVAVELDTRATGPGCGFSPGPVHEQDVRWDGYARRRETLERLGVTLVHLAPDKLRDAPAEQAAIVRTALVTAAERDQAGSVTVEPR